MDAAPSPVVGSLADMPGAEVLRALARTGTSGILKVGETNPTWAAFADGDVVLAGAVGGPSLADALRASGAVGEDVLRDAVTRGGPHDLALLHELSGVEAAGLVAAVRDHTVAAVFQMLLPSTEQFAFQPGAALATTRRFAVGVDELLAAAEARVREWAEVAASVPSTQAVFRPARTLEDGTAAVSIERDDWAVLAVLDGRRTVAQVVAATGRGSFEVLTSLHRLVQRGLLERLA